MSSPLAGALTTTFCAPASMCFWASSRLVNSPVDSITISAPSSFQGRLAGSRSASTLIRWPSMTIASCSAELLRDHDRAMTPAGAPDRDGEVGLPFRDVARDDRVEERSEAPHELTVRSLPGDVGVNLGVRSRERAQPLDPVWVREEPDVQD